MENLDRRNHILYGDTQPTVRMGEQHQPKLGHVEVKPEASPKLGKYSEYDRNWYQIIRSGAIE